MRGPLIGDVIRSIGSSGVASPLTGTTSETVLATITVPPLGANDSICMRFMMSMTNNANAKTVRVRLGGLAGTVICAGTVNSQSTAAAETFIFNRNSSSAQYGGWFVGRNLTITTATATASIATASGTTIVITGQLGVGTDTLTLEGYDTELSKN